MVNGITNTKLGMFVGTFIILIVGIVLLGAVADREQAATTISTIINETATVRSTQITRLNESITITSAEGNTGNGSVMNVTYFGNTTANTDDGGISFGVEVNWTKGGNLAVNTDNFTDGSGWLVSYIYEIDGNVELANDDIETGTYFGNASISTDESGFTIGTEINFSGNEADGNVTVNLLNFSSGTGYNVSYTYQGDDYIDDSTSRQLISLLPLFFAIAVLTIAMGMGLKSFLEFM